MWQRFRDIQHCRSPARSPRLSSFKTLFITLFHSAIPQQSHIYIAIVVMKDASCSIVNNVKSEATLLPAALFKTCPCTEYNHWSDMDGHGLENLCDTSRYQYNGIVVQYQFRDSKVVNWTRENKKTHIDKRNLHREGLEPPPLAWKASMIPFHQRSH